MIKRDEIWRTRCGETVRIAEVNGGTVVVEVRSSDCYTAGSTYVVRPSGRVVSERVKNKHDLVKRIALSDDTEEADRRFGQPHYGHESKGMNLSDLALMFRKH